MTDPIEVEAWIDHSGLARRVREVVTIPSTSGRSPLTMDMRIDFFDFGVAPTVNLPDAGEVFDSTQLGSVAELG
jgi:hypothetical protein